MDTQEFYTVKMDGQYFAQVGKDRVLRGYEASFKLPDASNAMSVIVGKLLIPYLRRKDPQCTGVYTHNIIEISYSGKALDPNDIPVRWQSWTQLKEYCRYHKLPIDTQDYGSLGLLREHIRLAMDEPNHFKTVSAKYQNTKAADKALYDLNPDTDDSVKVNIPVEPSQGGESTEEVVVKQEITKKKRPARYKKPTQKPIPAEPTEPNEPEDLLS